MVKYVGIDAQRRFMGFKSGYGSSTLCRSFLQSNLYFGLRFNDYFGVEVGYEETARSERKVTLYAGDMAAGAPIHPIIEHIGFKSTIKVQGPHVGSVAFFPVSDKLDLFCSAGISFLKGTSTRTVLFVREIPVYWTRTMVGRKQVPRISIGAQYEIKDGMWLRGAVGTVSTHKLRIVADDGKPGLYLPEIKPKSSKILGIGLMWEI